MLSAAASSCISLVAGEGEGEGEEEEEEERLLLRLETGDSKGSNGRLSESWSKGRPAL